MRVVAGAVAVTSIATLALPEGARAHGGSGPVAVDHRLRLDPSAESFPGVEVKVHERRGTLELRVAPGVEVLVQGRRGEPMVRIDDRGAWINASSQTARDYGLASPNSTDWVRMSDERSLVWDEHRLRPPAGGADRATSRFSIPAAVDGRPVTIAGSIERVPKPAAWPWLAGGLALAVALGAGAALGRPRGFMATWLGTVAGAAALAVTTSFALRASSTGGVDLFQLVAGLVAAAVLGTLLVVLHGSGRTGVAGVVGVVAVAVGLGFLPVFWHSVVVSAAPGTAVRLACTVALVCGGAAGVLSFLAAVEEPARSRP